MSRTQYTWTRLGELIAKSANTPWMAGAMKRATVKSVENIAVWWEEGEGGRAKKAAKGGGRGEGRMIDFSKKAHPQQNITSPQFSLRRRTMRIHRS
jgi:hypothetical protein